MWNISWSKRKLEVGIVRGCYIILGGKEEELEMYLRIEGVEVGSCLEYGRKWKGEIGIRDVFRIFVEG